MYSENETGPFAFDPDNKSFDAIFEYIKPAYFNGIQYNLLDFCDRTRLTSCVYTGGSALSCKIPAKVRLKLTPSFNSVPMVRISWQTLDPTHGLSEAVHCEKADGSEDAVSRSEAD